jgi:outer membrane protein OmpA-like peptidoglycan-associated protein
MMNQALVAVGAVCVVTACAARQPPPELADARTVYGRVATRSEASKLAPQALNDARIALAAAEEPFQKGAPAYLVRDRAYIAIRAAELAQVYASTERTREEIARLPGKAADLQARVAAAERKIDEGQKPPAVESEAEPPPARGPTTSALSIDDEWRGTVITVPAPALFRGESTDFLPGAEARLEPVAKALTDEQKTKILVETHTDSVGSAVDPGLSMRRADLVRNFLVAHEVKPDRVSVAGLEDTGKGETIAQPREEADGRPNIIVSLKTPSP